ncbi:DNA-processing protein DprA [Tabrizicola aquatica]|uniref:DNA-processing protein DprA n=1 Tax=Tabrizicola aquatica TaxID=909926 RepID=UPI000CD1A42B|nr:DNA-processing protein DprA [Tabrizicola aquatica]
MDGQLSNPTLPRTEDDRLDRLRLVRSRRVGAVTYHRLMAEHGTARAALDALPGIARAAGVEEYEVCPLGVVQAELKAGRALGARLLVHGEADYPQALAQIADAPPVLWVLGDVALLNRPLVALVGARNASSLGVRMARRLGQGLAETGFTVVSGLARGIDAAAHEAALEGEGRTIAVMAGGVDVIYPPENAALAQAIADKACRISEHPPGLVPQARHFPLRNRIVAGMSRAVVVVEAAAKSGSLITARAALDYGREVMAVPGHPFDARASGCNGLIRDGALLVRGPADVAEALGTTTRPEPELRVPPQPPLPGPQAPQRPLKDVALLHSMILARLGPSPLAEDQLVRDLNVTPAQIAPELLSLELDGRIARQPGGLLARVD